MKKLIIIVDGPRGSGKTHLIEILKACVLRNYAVGRVEFTDNGISVEQLSIEIKEPKQ